MRILFLVEHLDRELTAAEQLAREFKASCNCEIMIASLQFHLQVLVKNRFDLIIVPYLFQSSDLTYKLWKMLQPNATILNLNWEQNLFKVNQLYKRLVGVSKDDEIYHIVWSKEHKRQFVEMDFFDDRLLICENLNILGQSAFFTGKNDREITGILNGRSLLFVPLNYNWSFLTQKQIQNRIQKGFDSQTAEAYRAFSLENRQEFIKQVKAYAEENPNVFVVLRPHPSISIQDYHAVDKGLFYIPNILVTHAFTAWDWVRHASIVVSSWSTVSFDCLQLEKPSYLFLPFGVPDYLDCAFIRKVPQITRLSEISHLPKSQFATNKQVLNTGAFVKSILSLLRSRAKLIRRRRTIDLKFLLLVVRSLLRNICMELGLARLVPAGIRRDYFKVIKVL